jgi:hypothetical protein
MLPSRAAATNALVDIFPKNTPAENGTTSSLAKEIQLGRARMDIDFKTPLEKKVRNGEKRRDQDQLDGIERPRHPNTRERNTPHIQG